MPDGIGGGLPAERMEQANRELEPAEKRCHALSGALHFQDRQH
jgi:hypothetical protein